MAALQAAAECVIRSGPGGGAALHPPAYEFRSLRLESSNKNEIRQVGEMRETGSQRRPKWHDTRAVQ